MVLYSCVQAALQLEQLFICIQYSILCVLDLWTELMLCAQGGKFTAPASTNCLTLIDTPWDCNCIWSIQSV